MEIEVVLLSMRARRVRRVQFDQPCCDERFYAAQLEDSMDSYTVNTTDRVGWTESTESRDEAHVVILIESCPARWRLGRGAPSHPDIRKTLSALGLGLRVYHLHDPASTIVTFVVEWSPLFMKYFPDRDLINGQDVCFHGGIDNMHRRRAVDIGPCLNSVVSQDRFTLIIDVSVKQTK